MNKLSPDEKWGRLNNELNESMKTNDFFGLGLIYYKMADFLESEGKNADHLKQLGYQMSLKAHLKELKRYKKSGVVTKVEIHTVDTSCDVCKKLDGKVILIDDAISNSPLPVKECNHRHGFCRCIYLPVNE